MSSFVHGDRTAIEWDTARLRSAAAARSLDAEDVPLADAIGRSLARDVTARQAIPHYASSAMDGWAVAGDPPWRVVRNPVAVLDNGTAVPVVTGGLIPVGADAVVRQEHGSSSHGMLSPRDGRGTPAKHADIRPLGEESAAGELLIRAGTVLNEAHIAVAAAGAHDSLAVIVRPRVALLLTGDEVDERGVPVAGRVRDSFGPVLPSLIRRLGGRVVATSRVEDRLDRTIASIDSAGAVELIVTTGGTGESAADHVRAALGALGAEVLVPRLAIRPGGPSLLARLPDGRLVVGLAGNPLAAIVGLLIVAAPALASWSGRRVPSVTEQAAAQSMAGHPRLTSMIPIHQVTHGVAPSPRVGSGMMRGLADSWGIAAVPAGGLAELDLATIIPLPWAAAREPVAAAEPAS